MKRWHVVVTEPQREAFAADSLRAGRCDPSRLGAGRAMGRSLLELKVGDVVGFADRKDAIEVYAPTFRRIVSRRNNRPGNKRTSEVRPLFPGYLFARFDALADPHWWRILATPGVRGLLTIGERAADVPDLAMERIRAKDEALERAGPQLRYAIGQEVELARGDFFGHIGRIEKFDGKGRAIVLLRLFQREVRVTAAVGGILPA